MQNHAKKLRPSRILAWLLLDVYVPPHILGPSHWPIITDNGSMTSQSKISPHLNLCEQRQALHYCYGALFVHHDFTILNEFLVNIVYISHSMCRPQTISVHLLSESCQSNRSVRRRAFYNSYSEPVQKNRKARGSVAPYLPMHKIIGSIGVKKPSLFITCDARTAFQMDKSCASITAGVNTVRART